MPAAPARTIAHAGSPRFFTLLLITINVAIFVLMGAVDSSGGHDGAFISPASQQVLRDFGERSASLIGKGEWWRLITPIFIHLGIIHLLFNNFALFQIGPLIEETFGSQKFVSIYLCCGIVGNIGSYAIQRGGGGASGALFGLIAIAAVYGYRMGGIVGRSLMRQMLVWAGLGLMMGMMPGIDNVNHLGGLIAGAALGFVLSPEQPSTARGTAAWNAAAILSMLLVTASFAMVALHYGQVRTNDLLKLSGGVNQMISVLDDSLNWKPGSGKEPQKIAAEIRSAADDIRRVQRIDAPSESIRARILDLAERRAVLFESAAKDPAAVSVADLHDHHEIDPVFRDYHQWEASVIADYGLVYERNGGR